MSDFSFDLYNKGDKDWNRGIEALGCSCETCRGLVSKTYVEKDAPSAADHLVVGFKDDDVIGFVFIKDQGEYFYIDVICAKGGGTALLNEVEKIAKEKGKKGIKLSALPHVVSYYRKFGYKHHDECAVEEDPEVLAKYNELLAETVKKYKGEFQKKMDETHSRRRKPAKLLTEEQKQERKEYDDYRKYLNFIAKKGLCKDTKYDKAQYCDRDGYRMLKCFK